MTSNVTNGHNTKKKKNYQEMGSNANSLKPIFCLFVLAARTVQYCNFDEVDLCGWKQDTSDDLDWTWTHSVTPTMNTGPNNDHTMGTSKGKPKSKLLTSVTDKFHLHNKQIVYGYLFNYKIILRLFVPLNIVLWSFSHQNIILW